MRTFTKIISALLLGCVVNAKAKAQSFQNKKAVGVQTFTLRLTMPAATQVDMTQTANKYFTQQASQIGSAPTEDKVNGLTVTDVSTESGEAVAANNTTAAQPVDKIQVITLSKA